MVELNRANLAALIGDADADARAMVVLDQWPGQLSPLDAAFFVMHSKTERLLRNATSTAVLSSRLPKILDSHRQWFDAIRTVGVKISRTHDVLLTGESMAAHPCCLRLAELFSIDCVTVVQLSLPMLKKRLTQQQWQSPLEKGSIFFVTQSDSKTDRVVAEVADRIFALSIGNKGNVQDALQRRLTEAEEPGRTFILHDDRLTSKSVREPLIAQGAVDWILLADNEPTKPPPRLQETARINVSRRCVLSDLDQSEYLIHWTRARPGAWPDQSTDDHWDDLIFGAGGYNHSDVFALCRILASRRIIASANLTRDSTPVVCFSNVPLGELRDKTVFRKHLQRWDFLPYGIAIKRSVLQKQFDCRPVVYGDDETWKSLADSDRPLFQLKKTSDQKIDWQQEAEWRVVGDVDLRKVNLNDAIVFAGDQEDLGKLSQLSIFDLIVI